MPRKFIPHKDRKRGLCTCGHELYLHFPKGCYPVAERQQAGGDVIVKHKCRCAMFADQITGKKSRNPFADYSQADEEAKQDAVFEQEPER